SAWRSNPASERLAKLGRGPPGEAASCDSTSARVKSAPKAADAATNSGTVQSTIDGNRTASLRNKSASASGERLIAFNYKLGRCRWTGIHLSLSHLLRSCTGGQYSAGWLAPRCDSDP